MSTKMECYTCNGDGFIIEQKEVQRCCRGSNWECGARGCSGPITDYEQEQVGCYDCQGTGYNLPERIKS